MEAKMKIKKLFALFLISMILPMLLPIATLANENLPDLVISLGDPYELKPPYYEGDVKGLSVPFKVGNIGTDHAKIDHIWVEFYVDGEFAASGNYPVDEIKKGEWKVFEGSIVLTYEKYGGDKHLVAAVVDSKKEIQELDENNNEASTTIYVPKSNYAEESDVLSVPVSVDEEVQRYGDPCYKKYEECVKTGSERECYIDYYECLKPYYPAPKNELESCRIEFKECEMKLDPNSVSYFEEFEKKCKPILDKCRSMPSENTGQIVSPVIYNCEIGYSGCLKNVEPGYEYKCKDEYNSCLSSKKGQNLRDFILPKCQEQCEIEYKRCFENFPEKLEPTFKGDCFQYCPGSGVTVECGQECPEIEVTTSQVYSPTCEENLMKVCRENCQGSEDECNETCEDWVEKEKVACKPDATVEVEDLEIPPPRPTDKRVVVCKERYSNCLEECKGNPNLRDFILPKRCENGCYANSEFNKCIPFGTRIVENGNPMYCDIDSELRLQKSPGEEAQNNYECRSNVASDGKCIDIGKQINIIERIFGWLARIFG